LGKFQKYYLENIATRNEYVNRLYETNEKLNKSGVLLMIESKIPFTVKKTGDGVFVEVVNSKLKKIFKGRPGIPVDVTALIVDWNSVNHILEGLISEEECIVDLHIKDFSG
jgi:hypothetical protein